MEMMVPKVQNRKPRVAALGEKGRMAATSMAGMALGTSFCWMPWKDSVSSEHSIRTPWSSTTMNMEILMAVRIR